MARQRTPDLSPRPSAPPPFAGIDEATGFRAWLKRRRKMLAALVSIPVSAIAVKYGFGDLLGADLGKEVELSIVTLIVGAIVERVPNFKVGR